MPIGSSAISDFFPAFCAVQALEGAVMAKAGGREGYDMQIKLLTIGNSGASTALGPQNTALHFAPLLTPPSSPNSTPAGVGKTCLLLRYANNSFSPTFITTIGIDFKIKTISVDDKRIKLQVRAARPAALHTAPARSTTQHPRTAHPANSFPCTQIWDTAGQERFRTITTSYFRGAHGILLVFDLTDKGSYQSIQAWLGEIQKNADSQVNKILIGNKCDVDDSARAVSRAEGEALAQQNGMAYFETSARKGLGVNEAFENIARQVVERLGREPKQADPGPVVVDDKNKGKAGGGCCK